MTASHDFNINQPDSERANVLAFQAMKKAEAEDFSSAISLIEDAIRLDSIAALNRFHALRAELCDSIGQDSPQKAIEKYDHAIHLKKSGRFRDTVMAYKEAASFDPLFLWPLNNLAWILSTSKDESTCNGPEAIRLALEACEKSNWNCWAFLGTLAAAYAAAGDFERAAGWQQAALQIVPEDHRLDSEIMLRHFQSKHRFIDEGHPVAAGSSGKDEENSSTRLLRPEKNPKRPSTRLNDATMTLEPIACIGWVVFFFAGIAMFIPLIINLYNWIMN